MTTAASEHTIAEAMAGNWDEQGHRHPWNWHITCTCGWRANALRTQTAAYDAWQEHAATEREDTR